MPSSKGPSHEACIIELQETFYFIKTLLVPSLLSVVPIIIELELHKPLFFFPVLLGRTFGSRGWLEVPGRRLDAGGQAKGQVRGLLQEEVGRRQDQRRGQEGPEGGQARRQVPEDHRRLRIRIKQILLFVDRELKEPFVSSNV